MNKSFFTIVVLLFGIVATATSQTLKATGIVRSQSDGQPLPGATIIETGTNKCVITDINGQFNIDVDANSTITVSFVGFENQTLQPSANMDIVLVDDIVLDDIVVTGYQVQRRRFSIACSISYCTRKLMLTPSLAALTLTITKV